ncbi:hypothetical protein ABPG77_002161 [Micractinium sp. CCAP 211/92]
MAAAQARALAEQAWTAPAAGQMPVQASDAAGSLHAQELAAVQTRPQLHGRPVHQPARQGPRPAPILSAASAAVELVQELCQPEQHCLYSGQYGAVLMRKLLDSECSLWVRGVLAPVEQELTWQCCCWLAQGRWEWQRQGARRLGGGRPRRGTNSFVGVFLVGESLRPGLCGGLHAVFCRPLREEVCKGGPSVHPDETMTQNEHSSELGARQKTSTAVDSCRCWMSWALRPSPLLFCSFCIFSRKQSHGNERCCCRSSTYLFVCI